MTQIGGVYRHPEHGLIYVISGSYWGGYGRVSNHWTFRKVKKDGSLGIVNHSGYAHGWVEVECEVVVTIKGIKNV